MMLERRPTAAIEDPQLADLSHIDEQGRARMVDVGDKPVTARRAKASGRLTCTRETLDLVRVGKAPKVVVIATAVAAGIVSNADLSLGAAVAPVQVTNVLFNSMLVQ